VPGDTDPLEVAARALRHRDRSAREVEARLERAGIDGPRRSEALETLGRLGYVDDDRFARTRADTLARRGRGDTAIRFELERAGVEAEAVETAIAALEPELERARAIVARDGATPRIARRLAANGFARETVEEVIAEDVASDGGQAV